MPEFDAYDGTRLAYREVSDGADGSSPPVICLPGGPMQASLYLGDLGGLSRRRPLTMLDLRGTGGSAVPEDAGTYRVDRQVDDVEALRQHLGLHTVDLLAHSAGANLAVLYATRYPERVSRLVLVTPSTFAVGLQPTSETRLAVASLRADEAWFGSAYAALQRVTSGNAGPDDWEAVTPFFHGRWDAAAQAHKAAEEELRNDAAADVYNSEEAYDPEATRTALGSLQVPTLFVAGEVDLGAPPSAVTEYAGLLPQAELVIQAGAGHFPWLDDPDRFVATVSAFLG